MSYQCIRRRFNKYNYGKIEEIFEKDFGKEFLVISGRTYETLKDASDDKELNINNLTYRKVYRRKADTLKYPTLEDVFYKLNIKDSVEYKERKLKIKSLLDKSNWPMEIRGKIYKNLRRACLDNTLNIHNLEYILIYGRIMRDNFKDIEDIFSRPKREYHK